jgi:hypothetical protein
LECGGLAAAFAVDIVSNQAQGALEIAAIAGLPAAVNAESQKSVTKTTYAIKSTFFLRSLTNNQKLKTKNRPVPPPSQQNSPHSALY